VKKLAGGVVGTEGRGVADELGTVDAIVLIGVPGVAEVIVLRSQASGDCSSNELGAKPIKTTSTSRDLTDRMNSSNRITSDMTSPSPPATGGSPLHNLNKN